MAERERPVGRVGVRALILCPFCEGQLFGLGSCGSCSNTGYLRESDGGRLAHVEQMQILATFALALDMDLKVATPEVVAKRRQEIG